jgi:hypothetical protein
MNKTGKNNSSYASFQLFFVLQTFFSVLQLFIRKLLTLHRFQEKTDNVFFFFLRLFFFQEKTGNVFFMFDSIESDALGSDQGLKSALSSAYLNASEPTNYAPTTSAAKIVFRVLGIAAPSDELKCQFAGVLQASVDEMVLSVQ